MGQKLTTTEFIEKSKQLHGDKYDYSKTVYLNSRSKVIIICPAHGAFEQRASSHLLGNGCPECARVWTEDHKSHLQVSSRKSRGMTIDEWIARAKAIHGDKYDYSQTVYVNQRTNVKIICPAHGLFEQKADSHICGYGCKLCGYKSEKRKGVHQWSDEQYEKIASTCMKKYGSKRFLDSVEGKMKISAIKSAPEYREKIREIISSESVQEKTKSTCLLKYGVTSAMKLTTVLSKVNDTKRRNGTWKASKAEDDMYALLCERFGKGNVVRQHNEPRYPFNCDFYVKPFDLFIELNATWLHGGHWFNECDVNDLNILADWRQKVKNGSRFYSVAIDVWTIRDVDKHRTAINNHLNYVVFWETDLSDFKYWIESGNLILNNVF